MVERGRQCNSGFICLFVFLAYIFWFAGCYRQSSSSSYLESSDSRTYRQRHSKRSMLDNLQYCCRDQKTNSGGNGFGLYVATSFVTFNLSIFVLIQWVFIAGCHWCQNISPTFMASFNCWIQHKETDSEGCYKCNFWWKWRADKVRSFSLFAYLVF